MIKLLFAPASPFARKVRVTLAEKKIEYEAVLASPWTSDSIVSDYNPLGKIPVLLLDDGTALYDSRVIVEYLDLVSPVSRLLPETTRQRVAVKRWEALADGICDAAVELRLGQQRAAAQRDESSLARQRKKIDLGVRTLAEDLGDKAWCSGEAYSLADIAAGCALGYLDLRHPDIAWRDAHANLVRLADKLGKRSSFIETLATPD